MIKNLSISYSDIFGGAAKASYRTSQCMSLAGIDSKMLVVKKLTKDNNVIDILSFKSKLIFKIKNYFFIILNKIFHKDKNQSFNYFNSPLLKFINKMNCDIVNLNWICAETLSIEDIEKINKPVVFTMHDMWAFCGSEHYLPPDKNRWLNKNKEIDNLKNFSLSLKTWKRKKIWSRKNIICPSNWMKNMVEKSILMHDWPVEVIPYPVSTDIFNPDTEKFKLDNRDINKKNILFVSFGDIYNFRKGLDLLLLSLERLNFEFRLILVGNYPKKIQNKYNFEIIYLNDITSERTMSSIYNLSDLVVIPSRMDNLPNTGLEAHACGKPIVGFDVGGMSDIVLHKQTGFLANPFDTIELAKYIEIVLNDKNFNKFLSINARKRALDLWSPEKISKKIQKLYSRILN
jgi:glycosyltransferase involved in cell wall biosynthesis